jgi:hypothetical protein
MNTLVDHYLLQLRSLLPSAMRDDIAAELSESIHSAVADSERELGRALSDDEVAAILKGYGHPLVVAGRYLPMQELISPRVFALYWYALQAVLIVIAVTTGILFGIALLTAPQHHPWGVVADGLYTALISAACVTLVFAVIDHQKLRMKAFENFDPRKLELGVFGLRAAPVSPIPRPDTVFEMATMGIFLLWWVGLLHFPSSFGSDVAIHFTAAWKPFFWPVIVLAVIDLARLAFDYSHPYRTWPRVLTRLVLNSIWLVLVVMVFRTPGLLEATGGNDATATQGALRWAQTALHFALGIWTVVVAALIATDVVRLVRR